MKNYIVRQGNGMVWVKFGYDEEAIDRIKCLDRSKREWDGDNKQWGFDTDLFSENETFLFPPSFYKRVDAPPLKSNPDSNRKAPPKPPPYTPPPRSQSPPSGPWGVLYLIPGAPREVAKAAYRALIAKHHPDNGGDEETAKRINGAWAQLEKLL